MPLKKSQSLKSWTQQSENQVREASAKTGERYFSAAIKSLTLQNMQQQPEQKNKEQKRKQFVKQPKRIAKKTRAYRRVT